MAQQGDDCYFFYYSACSKGAACPFRHCEEALGNEVMCTLWEQGRCYRPVCQFRHMQIEKQRSSIPCYWENQPSGCTKPHCAFLHTKQKNEYHTLKTTTSNPRLVALSAQKNLSLTPVDVNEENPSNPALLRIKQTNADSDIQIPSPKIEPIVVNTFEDESDQESTNGSPVKKPKIERLQEVQLTGRQTVVSTSKQKTGNEPKIELGIKSLEEIRKEKIASVKKQLAEADSLTEGDFENTKEDFTTDSRSIEEIQREKALKSLGKYSDGKLVTRKISSGVQNTGPIRRVVLANEGRENENISKNNKLTPGRVKVTDRLGIVRKVTETSGDNNQKESNFKGKTIKSRLGIIKQDVQDAEIGKDLKSRLGLKRPIDSLNTENEKETSHEGTGAVVAVKSLEQIRQEKQAKTDSDVPIKIKTLDEIRREKAARLGKDKSQEADEVTSSGASNNMTVSNVRTLKVLPQQKKSEDSKTVEPTNNKEDKDFLVNIPVKTLAEIRREKQKKTQSSPEDPTQKNEPVTVKTLQQTPSEQAADQDAENKSSVKPRRLLRKGTSSEEGGSEGKMKARKTVRRTVTLYEPPAKKQQQETEMKNKEDGQTSRKISTSKEAATKSPKKPDWGVKTFSEIMREKQLAKLKEKEMKEKSQRPISPIVFKKGEGESTEKPSSTVKPVTAPVRPLVNPRRRTLSKRGTTEDSDSSDSSSLEDEPIGASSADKDEPISDPACVLDNIEKIKQPEDEMQNVSSGVVDDVSETEEQRVSTTTQTVTSSSAEHEHNNSAEVTTSGDTQESVTSSVVASDLTDDVTSTEKTVTSAEVPTDTDVISSADGSSADGETRTSEKQQTADRLTAECVSDITPHTRAPSVSGVKRRESLSTTSVRADERPAKMSCLDSSFDEDLDALLGDMSDGREDIDQKNADDADLLQEMEELLA